MAFVRDVAAKIQGLTVPSGSGTNTFPKPFLAALREANQEMDTRGRNSLYAALDVYPSSVIKKEYLRPTTSITPKQNNTLIGGTTPEELAKILLNTLKKNDQKIWAKTVLTLEKISESDRTNYEEWAEWHRTKRFQLLREGLEGQGVTNWDLVVFSRVMYDSSPFDTEKRAGGPIVEFTYKEFVGTFNFVVFSFKNGKYYVTGAQPRILSKGDLRRNSK